MTLTYSDRSSLVTLLQNKHPVYWHPLQLKRVSSQDPEKYYHVYTKEGGKKNQALLALVLTFSHSWKAKHSTLKNSWHKFLVYVVFAATSFHSNHRSYISFFMGCMLHYLFCLKESCTVEVKL